MSDEIITPSAEGERKMKEIALKHTQKLKNYSERMVIDDGRKEITAADVEKAKEIMDSEIKTSDVKSRINRKLIMKFIYGIIFSVIIGQSYYILQTSNVNLDYKILLLIPDLIFLCFLIGLIIAYKNDIM